MQVWRLLKPNVYGVRIIAVDDQERVLLVRHSYGTQKWTPPSGGMRFGEDPLETAVRECTEEVQCDLLEPRILEVFVEPLHGCTNTVSIIAGRVAGQPCVDGREIIEARFFPANDLPEPMPHGMAVRVKAWLAQSLER